MRTHLISLCPIVSALMFLATVGRANAGNPVALVEDVLSGSADVVVMQFLETSDTIELGTNGEIVLSYLSSCVRETVSGGQIKVGERQSIITDGLVVREKVNCDTDQLVLSSNQSNESGVVTFRAAVGGDPVVTVYGTRPVFVFEGVPSEIMIERRDRKVANIRLTPGGRVYDMSTTKFSLFPNGIYRAHSGDKSVTIRVDSAARANNIPFISRLVRF